MEVRKGIKGKMVHARRDKTGKIPVLTDGNRISFETTSNTFKWRVSGSMVLSFGASHPAPLVVRWEKHHNPT